MRFFEVYITTTTSPSEEMKLNDNKTVKFVAWVDTIFNGLMAIWFTYLTLGRGLSKFIGGTPSTYFDVLAIFGTFLQLIGDVSYMI
jgi:hypothetical protein